MMTIDKLYEKLSGRIPPSLSCEGDVDGYQLRPSDAAERKVKKILIALDPTAQAIHDAVCGGYDLLLTHHPVIYRPLTAIVSDKLIEAAENRLALMSFHTRLDSVDGGVNDVLAAAIGLQNVEAFLSEENVAGRIGTLSEKMTVRAFAEKISEALGAHIEYPLTKAEDPLEASAKIAVLGGSGKSCIAAAKRAGAAVYLTGECSYNTVIDEAEEGFVILTAGHYHTEVPVCRALREMVLEIVRRDGGEVRADLYQQKTLEFYFSSAAESFKKE